MRDRKVKVRIVEVGMRDGLQNESSVVSATDRIKCVEELVNCGFDRIEIGAFVRPDKVPQMAGTSEIVSATLSKFPDKQKIFTVLVPNMNGFEQANALGVKEIAIFASSSETFSQKNINCSIAESFERFTPVIKLAKKNKIKIRGYLSVCFGCPYEGEVDPKKVATLIEKLFSIGCYEVSVGDTIGIATPDQVRKLFQILKKKKIDLKKVAGHFHDTRGTAIANVYASLLEGVTVFDSSLGGLGGCPYAPGSAGNVATEDVVYFLHKMGYKTGINLEETIRTSRWFFDAALKRTYKSKMAMISN